MIKIENVEVHGWESAIRGCRNPMNSWYRMDSYQDATCFRIGPNDHDLMMRLAKAGSEHAKYRRMIVAWVDVTAPLYWWAEADTYKVGTVRNSCSKMHRIHSKPIELSDFSIDSFEMLGEYKDFFTSVVYDCEELRQAFIKTEDKRYWRMLIQLLPESYNQRATIMLNYEVLSNIYRQRKNHKLDEWRTFCQWIKTLPYSELITLEEE